MNVVIDTNILFSALLKTPNKFAETIFLSDDSFYAPKHVVSELFKHQKKIIKASRLPGDAVFELLFLLSKRINIADEKDLSHTSIEKAYDLCKNIDPMDTMIVALALDMKAPLWTGDKILIKGLLSKGYNNFYKIK